MTDLVDLQGQPAPEWLHTWEDLTDMEWTDLLVGNGMSRHVSPRFEYETLAAVARERSSPRLTNRSQELFSLLDLADFEQILKQIRQTERIVEVLDYQLDELGEIYDNVRDALAGAVQHVHPGHQALLPGQLSSASDFFAGFTKVFTTNYDLLLYWAAMEKTDRFVDFFWSRDFNFAFDVANLEVYGDRTRLYYLHGALMLYETDDGRVAKRVSSASQPVLLDAIGDRIRDGELPVFVSEGDSTAKLRAINGHSYLDFCLRTFATSSEPIVVAGHGLGEADGHILDALAKSSRTSIAVGLWPTSLGSLELERERINHSLGVTGSRRDRRSVHFFDFRTLNPWQSTNLRTLTPRKPDSVPGRGRR